MTKQSEQQLENNLIKQLVLLDYQRITISNNEELVSNLRTQFEIHNAEKLKDTALSDDEFKKILNILQKGSNVFDKAKILRGDGGDMHITRDDGSNFHFQFINKKEWCKNQFQVTNQVTIMGKRENRYDVTLLVNGLPLVQIELKRRGLEINEAFNQVNRYHRDSYGSQNALFQYVQIFVISNGVDTKYFANNRKQSFKQTFHWTDEENKKIASLEDFTESFLKPCTIAKMITKYVVMHEGNKSLMILRPYQYYASEMIVDKVKNGRSNGYIWHTTGSGKTLTSFKTAQSLRELPKVDKILFVVDRRDLDHQTNSEFNAYQKGCVDETSNTKELVAKLADKSDDSKLIVTTLQKLNKAIGTPKHASQMESMKGGRVVFIFDECHRSQFGDTHKNIKEYFSNVQMFGFTGTPILEKNSYGEKTTKSLFDECLHKYVITNAIADENVLPFSVEYWGKLKKKDGSLIEDADIKSIDKKEFFEDEDRIENIVGWVINNHDKKTHGRKFSAMMCVGSIDALIKYYDIFKKKKNAGEHNLRIATIYTYGANEEDADANGMVGEVNLDADQANIPRRDKLESYLEDYNAMFGTNQSLQKFNAYYTDLSKRLKDREREDANDKDRLDILLVVNIFLTGFDAKKVNTMYVDKNLKYHGLIQTYSRTNRTLDTLKSQGNIVCFRNLKANTDEALVLYGDKNANDTVILPPYEDLLDEFNQFVSELRKIAHEPAYVPDLIREDDKASFIKAFRNLIRVLNKIKGFSQFTWDDLDILEQEFEDYKSHYFDLYDSIKDKPGEKPESIIGEIDFEIELLWRDDVNVAYILDLITNMLADGKKDNSEILKTASEMLNSEPSLRSKKALIEEFIQENMLHTENGKTFAEFWAEKRDSKINSICSDLNMNKEKLEFIISEYERTNQEPLPSVIVEACNMQPKILERKAVVDKAISEVIDFVDVYVISV